MSRLLTFARENGWAQLISRSCCISLRKVRDTFTARQLNAPHFRIGGSPRLLGLSHMRIGSNFTAGDNLWLEAITTYAGQSFSPTLTIGDNVNVSDSVHIACLSSVTIGAGTLLGSRIIITDHSHGSYQGPTQSDPATIPTRRPLSSSAPVIIGKNVWIGDGAAILPGASIGDGAIIGANSVVTGPIPAATIAFGAPARPVRQWNPTTTSWEPLPPITGPHSNS